VIEYLREEIRVLKERLGKKPWFNDGQRPVQERAANGLTIAPPLQNDYFCQTPTNELKFWRHHHF
jgi:hypothetical protein